MIDISKIKCWEDVDWASIEDDEDFELLEKLDIFGCDLGEDEWAIEDDAIEREKKFGKKK